MNKGEAVVVRGYHDRPYVGYIWKVLGDIVYVTTQEGLKDLQEGNRKVIPIGFKTEDVFEFFESYSSLTDWKKAKKWKER